MDVFSQFWLRESIVGQVLTAEKSAAFCHSIFFSMQSVASPLKKGHKFSLKHFSLTQCFSACLSEDDPVDSKQVKSGEKNSGGKNASVNL